MSLSSSDLNELSAAILDISVRAGQEVLAVYGAGFDVYTKSDATPVTDADRRSEQLILDALTRLVTEIPVVAEESYAEGRIPEVGDSPFFLVDPLDGTKEFVSRNGEFTVNIALIKDHRPVLGVVRVPVLQKTYIGCEGHGAEVRDNDGAVREIQVSAASRTPPCVVGSRSHRGASLDAYLDKLGDYDLVPMGSSLKFCVVAEGTADVYPRLGPTSEWDTAAAQAVVEQAGGSVVKLDGKPLSYNAKEDILNPWFIVIGAADVDWLALLPDGE